MGRIVVDTKDHVTGQSDMGDISTTERIITAPVLATDGTYLERVSFDAQQGRRAATYWYRVLPWVEYGDSSGLRELGTWPVAARDGTVYTLETDPAAVMRWWDNLIRDEPSPCNEMIAPSWGLER